MLIIFAINLNVPITFGFDLQVSNSTTVTFCFYLPSFPNTRWMDIYNKIHLLLYSAIPFFLLFIINALLIYFLVKINKVSIAENKAATNRKTRTTKTIIIVTMAFIIFTLPGAICSYYFSELISLPYGYYILVFFDCVTFSYHGLNSIILYNSNKLYKKEVRKFIFRQAEIENGSLTAGIMSNI